MGKAQPANVGLNCVIKHQLKQSQLKYLIETYRKQVTTGLPVEQCPKNMKSNIGYNIA